jgi:protein-tyrosine phosphatase
VSKVYIRYVFSTSNAVMYISQAIEFSQSKERVPSCIEEAREGRGGLWHGGFKAVMNHQFLKTEGITHVVNTAKGLEIFGPRYTTAVEKARSELGVTFQNLDWIDSTSFDITDASLSSCCAFIHHARNSGASVLVHCAQGKSRSATAVIAHMMASHDMTYLEALAAVQGKRKMAEPNPAFQQRLRAFEKSEALAALRAELTFQ